MGDANGNGKVGVFRVPVMNDGYLTRCGLVPLHCDTVTFSLWL